MDVKQHRAMSFPCCLTKTLQMAKNVCFLLSSSLWPLLRTQKCFGEHQHQQPESVTDGWSSLKICTNTFFFFSFLRCKNMNYFQLASIFFYTWVSYPPFWQWTKGSRKTAMNYWLTFLSPTALSKTWWRTCLLFVYFLQRCLYCQDDNTGRAASRDAGHGINILHLCIALTCMFMLLSFPFMLLFAYIKE